MRRLARNAAAVGILAVVAVVAIGLGVWAWNLTMMMASAMTHMGGAA